MKINYEIECTCGTKMHTNHGMSINGLEVIAKGYGKENKPVEYRGATENWKCPECGKEVEVYTGFQKGGNDNGL